MAQLAVVGLGNTGGRSARRVVGPARAVYELALERGLGDRDANRVVDVVGSLAGGIRRRRAVSCALRRRALACMPVTIARWRR